MRSDGSRRLEKVALRDGAVMYIESLDVTGIDGPIDESDDFEISANSTKRLEPVFAVLTSFATTLTETVKDFRADKVVVEFGCEVAVESGGLTAVIGKASGTSSMNVTLEWTR